MFPALAAVKQIDASQPHAGSERLVAKRHTRAQWLSFLGWLLIFSGACSVLLGFSDLQNLAVLIAMGIIFIPLGLLVVASGQILAGLAAIEKNIGNNNTNKSSDFPGVSAD